MTSHDKLKLHGASKVFLQQLYDVLQEPILEIQNSFA